MDETRELIERAARSADEARRVSAHTKQIVRTSREIKLWAARVQRRIANEIGSHASVHSRSNFLLGSLPLADYQRLTPLMKGVCFQAKQVLYRAGTPIEHVYFPVNGLLSIVLPMRDGNSIEVAAIGNEGMVGLTALMGSAVSPYDVIVQIPGEGMRIELETFRKFAVHDGTMYGLLTEYQNVAAVQTAYQVACNGLHILNKRCCRRLLTLQDRTGVRLLPITQESFAMSLGVRRATLSEGFAELQSLGAIKSCRGQIEILDRPKLQSLTCECYQAINDEYARLFSLVGSN